MAKKQLISFCPPEETPAFGGLIHYKNPRYFYDNQSIPSYATHFIAKEEHIRQAYLKAGVEEYGKVQERKEEKERQIDSAQESPSPAVEDNSSVVEDPDVGGGEEIKPIEDMSWPELRAYAASLTDEPIKNKEVALRVIAEKG